MIEEVGSQETRELIRRSSGRLFASELQRLEMRSAIVRRHFIGDLTDEALRHALVAVDEVLDLFTLVPVSSDLLTRGIGLLMVTKLRSLDALQLATALFIAEQVGKPKLDFVTADRTLRHAAAANGLGTPDPEQGNRR